MKKISGELINMPSIFITGTDTGCGKTVVSAALVSRSAGSRNNNINIVEAGKHFTCGYMKPISCGNKKDNDATFVKKLCNLDDPVSTINPISLPYPLSPLAAAKKAKKKLTKKYIKSKIIKSFKKLSKKYDQLIIEGVGGALVPITKDYMAADLIKDLKIPAIIVARAGLGTLNHTLLTIEALRKRKIKILGIIMNGYAGKELSEKDNAEIIKEISGVPILAKISYCS
ncbi:MAG: dethiobiotin synthase [Candidatus Saganbacteria bacterium]|nr:dethiobiotin synthase [Candidatus Saganbacteria bacterium]